jgi:hypothetical protein
MKTLMTLVLKTATVAGVKPVTPADRIGLGFGVANAYPTDNLSPGLFPVPHNPAPEQARERQLSAMQPRMRVHMGDDAVPPAGPAGLVPGVSAVRFAAISAPPIAGWQPAMRTAAVNRTREVCRFAAPSRTRVPGDLRLTDRLGCDCQSPDRSDDDKRIALRIARSAATARK